MIIIQWTVLRVDLDALLRRERGLRLRHVRGLQASHTFTRPHTHLPSRAHLPGHTFTIAHNSAVTALVRHVFDQTGRHAYASSLPSFLPPSLPPSLRPSVPPSLPPSVPPSLRPSVRLSVPPFLLRRGGCLNRPGDAGVYLCHQMEKYPEDSRCLAAGPTRAAAPELIPLPGSTRKTEDAC